MIGTSAEQLATVSFIIPHKGREELLKETLNSIQAQHTYIHYDVVVVTQNSELSDLLKSTLTKIDGKAVFAESRLTIATLRNLGASQSTGKFLAFLDADIALSENWLEAMALVLTESVDVVLSSAIQKNSCNPTDLEKIRTALSNAVRDENVAFLPGRNLFLARDTFDEIGGFPDHLTTCEDYYFTDKVKRLGNLRYSSAANYVHLGEDKLFLDMFRKEVWRGQSNLKSLRGRRVSLKEWPSLLVPTWVTLLTIASVALAIFGQSVAAFGCCVLALIPLCAYVLRLLVLTRGSVRLSKIVTFYILYFPARAWGTFIGAFRLVGQQLHDQ